jgi:lipid-A-disaccharide synthase
MANDNKDKRRALIIAGETSGDHHGAGLIRAARKIDPGLSFFGVGGPLMKSAGCEILIPHDQLMVTGLVEVIAHFPTIRRAFNQIKSLLTGHQPPDLLVLIDYPDFNLRLARHAQSAGVPVLYYVSPQVWAWRKKRIYKIAKVVDRLAAILPFESEIYKGLDIEVEYVGNPLLDEMEIIRNRTEYLNGQGIEPTVPVIGLFPGSRQNEIRYNLDTIIKAAQSIYRSKPQANFLLPLAPFLDRDIFIRRLTKSSLPVTIVQDNIYDVANASDAVIAVSGTVTLQVALTKTPMVIIYKAAPITHFIASRMVKVPHIGLVNIVAGSGVVKEFIQDQATPGVIAEEIFRILDDRDYRENIQQGLSEVRNKMGEPGCSFRVANMASEMSRGILRSEDRDHPSTSSGQGNQ